MQKVIHHPRFSDPAVLVGHITFESEHTEVPSPSSEPAPSIDPETAIAERMAEIEEHHRSEVEKAYQFGVVEGREQIRREMEVEVRNTVERLIHLIDDIASERQNVIKGAATFIVRLACEVARRVVGVSTVVNSEAILANVSRSITHLTEKTSLTIKIHPDDLEVVRRHRADWLAPENGIAQIMIETDPQISRGGCMIDTDSGIVDGRIESQLKLLQDELLKKVTEEIS